METDGADAGVGIALVGVAVAVARLAQSQVDALDGARVAGVAVFAREALVTDRARTLLHFDGRHLAVVPLLGVVQRHFRQSVNQSK